jgi:hypothetical protein
MMEIITPTRTAKTTNRPGCIAGMIDLCTQRYEAKRQRN